MTDKPQTILVLEERLARAQEKLAEAEPVVRRIELEEESGEWGAARHAWGWWSQTRVREYTPLENVEATRLATIERIATMADETSCAALMSPAERDLFASFASRIRALK